MQNSLLRNILLLILPFQLLSCKKDVDEDGPEITFNTPFENQSFEVYEHIAVSAEIKDETKIQSVTITLVDVNFIPVHNSLSVPVTSPQMSVNTTYELDNIHLASGSYYLQIAATDGKNDARVYRQVIINGVPKALKRIMLATNSGTSATTMSYIDSTFSGVIPFHSFSGDYLGISASSYYQEVFLCGNYTGSYTALEVPSGAVKFTMAPLVTPSPYFTAYYSEEKNNYVARFDGTIKGYDQLGNVMYNANANSGYYARKLIINNGTLLAEEKSKTSASRLLVSFYATGMALQQVAISQDVVAFCRKDDDNVFVFGNASSTAGLIQLYDRVHNNLWTPYGYTMPPGNILSVVRINMNTYLIAYSNGTIYQYDYQLGSLTTYLTGYTAVQLKYDEVNNRIYIAESHTVTGVDYPSKTIVNTVSSGETILGMDLLYNL